MQIGHFPGVSDVFANAKSDFATFRSLLESLSRADSLLWCARWNSSDLLEGAEASMDRLLHFLGRTLNSDERDRLEKFFFAHGGKEKVRFFVRGSLLELMRWIVWFCHDHPDDGNTFKELEVRRQFVQAVFTANEVWSESVSQKLLRFEEDGAGRKTAVSDIRRNIEGTRKLTQEDLLNYLGRGWDLFSNHFVKHYPSFEDEFRSVTELSLREYYWCVSPFIAHIISVYAKQQDQEENTGLLSVEKCGESEYARVAFSKYFDLHSQTVDELRNALWGADLGNVENYDDAPLLSYRAFRDKPILRTNDGRAVVLDPIFYGEGAAIGPLFKVLHGKDRRSSNTVFGAFGCAFEDYACEMLNRMFNGKNSILAQRLFCRHKITGSDGSEIEVDACLNDVTEVVVFEMKARFVKEEAVLNQDWTVYQSDLTKKYAEDVGIPQLARAGEIISSLQASHPEFGNVKHVHPVLLVYDAFLDTPGHTGMFMDIFRNHLKPDQESGCWFQKGRIWIAAPIVMTIDDLELLEDSVSEFGFIKMLHDYVQWDQNSNGSLREFLAFSEKYRGKLRVNKHNIEKAEEIMGSIPIGWLPGDNR